MICPYCEQEMEKGYIDHSDFRFPLEWYPAKRDAGIFWSRKNNIKLTSVTDSSLTAYYCAACRKFIIDRANT